MIFLMIILSATSFYFMNKIGGKSMDIAKEDIPLTKIVTKIETHQLEQVFKNIEK